MNIILVEAIEIQEGSIQLEGERAKHIVKVLRSEIGNDIKIGVINGKIGTGKIVFIQRKYPFLVKLDVQIESLPPEKPVLDLILALPRPIMLKRILSQVTALGVGTIHLVNANRVEKSFWESGIVNEAEYRPHLLHGLEQAVDTIVPKVVLHRRFKPFIEDFVPGIISDYSTLICAHPDGEKSLVELVDGHSGKILLAVGPEGGWVDFEVAKFESSNFNVCSIGQRILKVDTAVVALHSRISALKETSSYQRSKKTMRK